VNQLQEESNRHNKKLKNEEAKQNLEKAALNRWMEAKRTISRIFKLGREEEIGKNIIEEFLTKGEKTYHPF
jgi:hypothetical protein